MTVLAVPLFTLGACATPTVEIAQPDIAVPAQWQIADPAPVSTDLTEYWTLLGDPLLSDFVEQAILENRDLAQSAARLELSLIHI